MHLLPIQSHSLDEDAAAVDLDLTPADVLILSFTDTDLAVTAAAWEADRGALPSLRLVNIGRLKHPYSVDLFIEKLAARARFVVLRLLGGADYWRYGLDELAAAARHRGFGFAALPGDGRGDQRLAEASTLPAEDLASLWAYFQAGGTDNVGQALRFVASRIGRSVAVEPPSPVPLAGVHQAACRIAAPGRPQALILFYRSVLLAADTASITAMADALASRGACVTAMFVTSLKEAASVAALDHWLAANRPDVIVNTTAFSARDRDGCVLDRADAPVLQAMLSGSDRASWAGSPRGLRAVDLAMNVVLPEVDGRIGAGVVSFKAETERRHELEYTRVVHVPDPAGISHVADLAIAWAALRRTPRAERRFACILSDYPGKSGRAGHAVGLDVPGSVLTIADHLREAGFDIGPLPEPPALMRELTDGSDQPIISLDDYRRTFARLPSAFTAQVSSAWGVPADDRDCVKGVFRLRFVRTGKLIVAVQPDRGSAAERRAEFHDPALPPRHGYVAFYLWLREVERCHALVHLGTHGSLEWLPGKAAALSEDCAPMVLTGALPVIYPFIVNNPGEAAQAKRRIGAVTLGHLTPPLIDAGSYGDTAELEHMFDEYAEASTLDAKRARLLGQAILDKATDRGFLSETATTDPEQALVRLDAWLCDLKEMRIGDGLHIFGESRDADACDPLIEACGASELDHLLRALDGRFVPPGPAGAPARARRDVLPTGRNMFTVDPRGVPTRTAWDIGSRMAEDLVTRYAQEHGDWPRRVVLDLWGSATMRTGGDDLAQAFRLIGARPQWDHATSRVVGFEILPLAKLGRARVDVTLRISGLFRDAFPEQIALFDTAVRSVAALDEPGDENPLAETREAGQATSRIFGPPSGAYGVGIARLLSESSYATRESLGEAYLEATCHAFGSMGEIEAQAVFCDRVATADAFSHTGDLPGQDILESDTAAEHEGGFAAAAALLGGKPALFHADTSQLDAPRLRSLAEEITRAVRARASNPRWLAGQMRHGWRGAMAMAETLDALFAFAATTDVVRSSHFDLYFDATCGDDEVRAFLERENPAAARSMAQKFEAALRNGYWVSRRNATVAILGEMQAERQVSSQGRAADTNADRAAPTSSRSAAMTAWSDVEVGA